MARMHEGPEAAGVPRRLDALRVLLRESVPEATHPGAVLALGVPGIDRGLPGGGLALGRLHEIAPAGASDTGAALGFALALAARHLAAEAGEVLLVRPAGHPLPYGHGLAGLGLDPGRLLLLEVGRDTEVFQALEAVARAGALRAAVGLLCGGLPLTAGRRLQIAAEGRAPLLVLLRPPDADAANGAATRWRVAAAPAPRDRFGRALRPAWTLRLDRCRNGRTGAWTVEWDRAAHRFGLAARMAGHAPAAVGGRA